MSSHSIQTEGQLQTEVKSVHKLYAHRMKTSFVAVVFFNRAEQQAAKLPPQPRDHGNAVCTLLSCGTSLAAGGFKGAMKRKYYFAQVERTSLW